jgi:farnesyl-diphosphate farnesyltransferase
VPNKSPGSGEVLDRTSRSFALSLRALPSGMRDPVEIAYLLARAADTIADRDGTWSGERAAVLGRLAAAVRGAGDGASWAPPGAAEEPAARGGAVAEGRDGGGGTGGDPVARAESALIGMIGGFLARLGGLAPPDRDDVRRVLTELIATMRDELACFPDNGPVAAIVDQRALTRYTEGIAGCVGVFWTDLAVRHVRAVEPSRLEWMHRAGRRYGRGLQLVNVLRDLPRDLVRGRCYLPESDLRAAGLSPGDLRGRAGGPADADVIVAVRPVLSRWERRARRGLLAGLLYAGALPARAWRLRFATALPARIGLPTLDLVAGSAQRFDPAVRLRVPRSEVRRALVETGWACLLPEGPRRLARRWASGNPKESR